MNHFRKVWTDEINEWIKTTKKIKASEAYQLFLKTFPEITDVSPTAFANQRSRLGAAGICKNLTYAKTKRPLYSEHVKKGYVRIKIALPNVWVSKSKWVYMETHPWEDFSERSNYIFLDGDNRNFNPNNIERVPIKLMGVFCRLGGCEKGHPEITRLRLLQAKLKIVMLDRGEKLGLVTDNTNGRRFKEERNARAREYNKRDYVRQRIRERTKERYWKLKAEGGEKWEHMREANRKARKKYRQTH